MAKKRKTRADWLDELCGLVSMCEHCVSFDEGEPFWLGHPLPLDDLLARYGVPKRSRLNVSRLIQCSHCGNDLELENEVVEAMPGERERERRWLRWTTVYSKKLDDFTRWLEAHPYLGSVHEVGREMLDSMPRFPLAKNLSRTWFRARAVRGPSVLTPAEMGPPPKPPATEGRFNHHGQSVFYLASDKTAAVTEVLSEGEDLAWVQEFRVTALSQIVDLRSPEDPDDAGDESIPMMAVGLGWSRDHLKQDDPQSEWKPQYFLPRFIADCARSLRRRGIVVESRKHTGTNLILFKWSGFDVRPVGKPRLTKGLRSRPFDDADADF